MGGPSILRLHFLILAAQTLITFWIHFWGRWNMSSIFRYSLRTGLCQKPEIRTGICRLFFSDVHLSPSPLCSHLRVSLWPPDDLLFNRRWHRSPTETAGAPQEPRRYLGDAERPRGGRNQRYWFTDRTISKSTIWPEYSRQGGHAGRVTDPSGWSEKREAPTQQGAMGGFTLTELSVWRCETQMGLS